MSKLLLITGPSGAGKTTTSKEFIEQAQGVWAYIAQDDIRQLVKAGYATADGYEQDWSFETEKQWGVSIPLCCDIARRYMETDINCLIDFNASPNEFIKWKKSLKGLDYVVVVLLPEKDIVLSRNTSRDRQSRLTNNKILQNYEKLITWKDQPVTIIDNSEDSVIKTVNTLNYLLK